MEGEIARSKTVTMNDAPRIRATSRRRVLSIGKSPNCSEYEVNNSEVISKIIAVIAIQMVMSDMERGNCISLTFYDLIPYLNGF